MSFAVFLLIIVVILLLFDLYFAISFRNFIKRNNYKKVYYRIVYAISIFFFLILVYNRIDNTPYNADSSDKIWITYALIFLWYLPKLLIIPFFLAKDIIRLIIWYIRKKKDNFLRLKNPVNRRLQNFGWILAIIPFIIVAKAEFITSQKFTIKEVPITSSIPELKGLKIVHISDIHAGSLRNSSKMLEVAEMINQQHPDLIFITGDFVNNDPNEISNISEGLKLLKSNNGIYGILGNHDHYMQDEKLEQLIPLIKNTGVDLLINENRKINIKNTRINIVGVDDLSFSNEFGDFDKALNGVDTSVFTIMLAHNPNNWKEYKLIERGINLTLSGHSHGGQVLFDCKFFRIAPGEWAYKEPMGLFKELDKYLYVNPGVGTTGPPIRIGIPPEITVINFK